MAARKAGRQLAVSGRGALLSQYSARALAATRRPIERTFIREVSSVHDKSQGSRAKSSMAMKVDQVDAGTDGYAFEPFSQV